MERRSIFTPLPVIGVFPPRQVQPRDDSNDPDDAGHVDPRQLQLHRAVPKRDVPYLPTDPHIVQAMLDLAALTPDDLLYDLGCGDGRIVIEAAKRGARAVGVDIDLTRIRECHDNLRKADAGGRARFVRGSFFDVDLRDATVVTLYLLPGVNIQLRPKLLFELRPGARVVANYFEIGDWKPDQTVRVNGRELMKWVIPAWVAGRWHCVLRDDVTGERRHMRLDLHRRYQQVWGTARVGGRSEMPLADARLVGEELAFTLFHWRQMRPPVRFVGRVEGNHIRGTYQSAAVTAAFKPGLWCGIRAGSA
jgi:precorrin-6B methylase 2